MFKISSEQSELRSQLNLLEAEVKRIKIIEEDWKREIQEGGVLLGTAILGFENDEVEERSFIASPEPREKQEERRRELEKMKIRLEELGGGGGVEITKEYKETLERDEFLTKELEDLKKSAESLQILIKELLEKQAVVITTIRHNRPLNTLSLLNKSNKSLCSERAASCSTMPKYSILTPNLTAVFSQKSFTSSGVFLSPITIMSASSFLL